MPLIVLTYHSHNIAGNDYQNNDHVAFAADLELLHLQGCEIVSLKRIVDEMLSRRLGGSRSLVALSFDDGPIFDVADFEHREFGQQRSFLNLLRDFQGRHGDQAQPDLHASSFVIASPAARLAMQRSPDCGYPDQGEWLGEGWWRDAANSGLMSIENHSWDHVHHTVADADASPSERDNFHVIQTYPDANRQIRVAGEYISARVGECEMFAYPFGHAPDYLVNDYFPNRGYEHGMVAAFGTEGRGISSSDTHWNIPRAVCGHHWRTSEELRCLIREARSTA
ncbi:MAG: hypothetical protein ABIQ72_06880 [Usitatibacter sp.]